MNAMMILLLTSLALSSCGGGGSTTSTPDTSPPTPITISEVDDYVMQDTQTLLAEVDARLQGLQLDDFFEQSFALLQQRTPESALSEGLAGQLDTLSLSNISDPYALQTAALQQRILEHLESYAHQPLGVHDQLSVDIYRHYLEQQLGWAEYYLYSFPATYGNFGWPGSTLFLFTDLLPVTSPEQAEQYLELARQVGRRMRQIETLLQTRQQAGIIEPELTLSYALNQVNGIAAQTAEASPYYTVLRDKLSALTTLDTAERQALLAQAKATIEQVIQPAYRKLADRMEQLRDQAPDTIGFGQFPGGQDFYDFTLQHYTDSDRSADEIHQLGVTQLERIHGQLRERFDLLGYPPNESIRQGLARAASEGGTVAGNQAVGRFESIIDAAYAELPAYFPTLPQQHVVVIGGSTGGYYVSGSDDGTRPGAFYAQTNTSLPYYTMPTLAYHEAVPGHHLQIALASELELPTFRRKTHFTSFVEGWGLYAERLAYDIGWYDNDLYADIGRLEFEAMRAARLVLDTGIHHQGWTLEQAEAFSLHHVGNRGSIARYSVYPGQATAYMTGLLDILSLRADMQSLTGEDFSLSQFHDLVIGQGAVPLSLLRPYVMQSLAGGG